ncbi:hypothetical protein AMAG_06648 [Allomyces macrogynus ATCC 38327]|uniref:Proteinase inhibitor I42 chagasin domain-containing protein n=1 Tax=Allomyces macrogynus (strain ATCC 38327) TaxID=578462 RepID=A0A0L0SEH5_ALLM3|nr:hypothetical protein AMAG_06648 [Allomyces macrogynus ATCC 38327]|eukprot:KNE60886.1 hypothetical protein AMAG_06648 [Allomyces macrogynus ATCC 38327]
MAVTKNNVRVGEHFTIHLDEDPSSGFCWTLHQSPLKHVHARSEEFHAPATSSAQSDTGACGTRVFTFIGLVTGSETIKFELKRDATILQTHQVHVQVTSVMDTLDFDEMMSVMLGDQFKIMLYSKDGADTFEWTFAGPFDLAKVVNTSWSTHGGLGPGRIFHHLKCEAVLMEAKAVGAAVIVFENKSSQDAAPELYRVLLHVKPILLPEPPRIDKAVTVTVGEKFKVELRSNRTTPCWWEFRGLSNLVHFKGSKYISNDASSGVCGVGGTEKFKFVATAPGSEVITIEETSPGMASPRTFNISVTVNPKKSLFQSSSLGKSRKVWSFMRRRSS